jgi:hypothetical protein
MQKINELVYLLAFLVLVVTTCADETLENQGEVDVHLRQVRATSISGCTNVTVQPLACGTGGCNVTFYRNFDTYGIFLSTTQTTTGFYRIATLPTNVAFNTVCLASNGTALKPSIWSLGYGYGQNIPLATLSGTNSGNFFSTGMASTPVGITGTITARSTVSLGVATIAGVATVTVGRVIDNAGVTVTSHFGGNGALSFNLCAPK